MENRRQKNRVWLPADETGMVPTWERANLAVLMDIRDELQKLNRLVGWPNFTAVPQTLQQIAKNTRKRKRVKK